MASWLSGRVASLVREASAEELSLTLEQRAKALTSPHSAAWLLSHWLEQCSTSEVYVLQMQGDSWHLSFMQVLLRSNAFELSLESCAKGSLREALTPGINASSQLLEHSRALRQALHSMAERLLLPGSLEVWPHLFDALLADATGPLPWDAWARRLISALKRPWRNEALWQQLSLWDKKVAEFVEASGHECTNTALRGTKLSKQAIRAEMTRRRLPQLAAEAMRLRRRSELMCLGLEAIRSVEEQNDAGSKEIRQLIKDAGLALDSLDSGLEGSEAEQKSLGQALSACSSELQRQMAAMMLTQESFVERRGKLLDEREKLQKRLEELDSEISQFDKEVLRCKEQVQLMRTQFIQNTSHYDGLLGGSSDATLKLCERKSKAGGFRDCAQKALALAEAAEAKRGPELEVQRRRREVQLGRQTSAYLREERLRLSATLHVRASGGPTQELPELTATGQEAWRAAQALLQRVDGLVGEQKEVRMDAETVVSQADSEEFFSSVQAKTCADCSSAAEWASVSYGVYLCMDCAGQHRGFGVHVSFVRSLAMDRWTTSQLRRMELGGTKRFLDFFVAYPVVGHQRYVSKAGRFYKRRLDAEVLQQVFDEALPSEAEGVLTEETELVAVEMDAEDVSLDAERAQLEATFLELQGKLAMEQ